MDTTPTTTTRRAGPADAEPLQEMLLELARHEDSAQHVKVEVPRWRELLTEDAVVVILAERAGQPVGYVSAVRQLNLWQGRDLLALDDLYVRPGRRGQRVGERLMRALAAYAATDRLLVRWELEQDNDGARRFYRRLGASVRDKGVAVWAPDVYAGT